MANIHKDIENLRNDLNKLKFTLNEILKKEALREAKKEVKKEAKK